MYEKNIEFLMYIDIGIKKKVLTKCILKLIVSYSQDRIFGFFLLWAHTIWAQSKKSAFLYMSNTYLPTFLCSLYVTFLIIFFSTPQHGRRLCVKGKLYQLDFYDSGSKGTDGLRDGK